jgi:phospholipid N-methyltransferase
MRFSDSMSDFTLFLGKFLRHGTAIASVAPSSRWLSRLAVHNIDWRKAATLVELGGGTGPITQAIAERASAECRVVVIERDPDFARLLAQRFGELPNFEIVRGDVGDLMAILGDRGLTAVDHIISGLPVPSFTVRLQESLFRAVRSVLRPEGTYNQITEIPWLYQKLYRRHFEHVQFVFEPRNMPPAGAYFCRRPRAVGEAPPGDSTKGGSSAIPRLAGAPVERRLVNLGFRVAGTRRRRSLERMNPARVQQHVLRGLIRRARDTRFGSDHRFGQVRSISDFQDAVPIRTYEALWADYLRGSYPILEDLTWPGRIPYLALSSGTTEGPSKFIPVSTEMVQSNRKAASTMLAWHQAARPGSKLFHGRICVLGGSTDLETVAPGVRQGDLSGIAAIELPRFLRPYTFPPLELALEADWDRKLSRMAETACNERISLVSGVPSWLRVFFERVLERTGKSTIAEVWPDLELVVHGGVKWGPYRESFRSLVGSKAVSFQEVYPSSEGFIGYGDPATGLLRLAFDHGLFYEFVPIEELDSARPSRHWLGTALAGVDYAIVVSTCAGMWAHLIGDTIRFEALSPPLFSFTGRTRYSLSAFGEHLINEEVESAIAFSLAETGSVVRDWHMGPVFSGPTGHHLLVIEFVSKPGDLPRFRAIFDRELAEHNADYRAHRSPGAGLPAPAVIVARPGSFEAWMRARGKLGGQHKVPRMDSSGSITVELLGFLRHNGRVELELASGVSLCEQS